MSLATTLLAAPFLLASGLPAQKHETKKTSPEATLKGYLQEYVKNPAYDYKAVRYIAAFVDLKGDGVKQAIVYFTDRDSCGSGGCATVILEPSASSYRIVTELTVVRRPIRVLETKSNGWHDIGVIVAGGGIQMGYEAVLTFDGKSYPTNPTVPPAKESDGKAKGEIVISYDAKDTALFP